MKMKENNIIKIDPKYVKLRKEIDEQVNKVNSMKITDNNTYTMKLTIVTDLNKVIKKVDDTRLELTAPLRAHVKEINDAGNAIIDDAKKAITISKSEIKAWDDELLREKAAEEERIAIEQREKEAAIEKRIQELITVGNEAMKLIGKAETLADLKKLSTNYYINFDQQYIYNSDVESVQELGQTIKQNILKAGKAANLAIKVNGKNLESVSEDILEKINENAANARVNAEKELESNKEKSDIKTGASYQTRWDFEIVNINEMPEALLMVNRTEVLKFIKGLKDSGSLALKDGNIINGIRLVKNQTAVLR